ncbi:MAG TPA: hypothetical protein VKT52_09995, partial [Ktedonobacterales bacterium]|nr:hypothetical protein [Ktedonobacterales bacterium]
EWLLWRRDAGRYYALLAAPRLRRELEQRRLQCISSYWTWLVIVVLGLILGGWHPAVPPYTPAQWTDAATLGFLAVWMFLNILEHAQTLAWKRRLLAAKEAPLETSRQRRPSEAREKSG